CFMLMIWSSRDRNKSCSPVWRRSRGLPIPGSPIHRDKPSESRFANQGNLKLILQGNSPFGGCFRQLEDLQILRFLCLISSFRVLHGRRTMLLSSNVRIFGFSDDSLLRPNSPKSLHAARLQHSAIAAHLNRLRAIAH
ncbi:hypothetical protein, partial [Rhizobium sp. RHZ01]|uniref:hypothetical protein n=1 Tax=Rhizobium sp. RHZ01 TaxID=2769304 RepID=UPI001AEE6531